MSERAEDIAQELKDDGVPAILDKSQVAEVAGCSKRTVDTRFTEARLDYPGHPRYTRLDVARVLAGE